MQECFYGQSVQDLEARCLDAGIAAIHAKNLFKSAYRDRALQPWLQPTLPTQLKAVGDQWWSTNVFQAVEPHVSRYDRTTKFVVTLLDRRQVEMVLIPEKGRLTLCVSSQVGCRQACSFCHTGRMGLIRQLSSGEIVGQVVAVNRWIDEHQTWLRDIGAPADRRVSNIVFMGMGEPLDNVEALIKAIDILTSPMGLGIAQRRISVSTAGHLEGLAKLHAVFPRLPIAISLHQADEKRRSQIMPINRRWPLPEVVEAIRKINTMTGNAVLIQYTLINQVNDGDDDADRLIALLSGLKVKVNLIPLNEIEPSRFGSPTPDRLIAFRNRLHQSGIRVMVRYSKGQDIAAACGQLVS